MLLRLPLKPTVPAEAQQSVSPFVSVIVTIVLLKVALMWAMPWTTFFRTLRFATLCHFCFFPAGSVRSDYRLSFTPFLPATVLLRSLAGAGVGLRPLPADGQAAAVPDAAIAADVRQPGDVLRHLAREAGPRRRSCGR